MIQSTELRDEHVQGVLCEKGFMKEKYCEKANELIRTFTPQGIAEIKEILKDPSYLKQFLIMLGNEIKDLPAEYQRGVIIELKLMLL